MKTLISFLFLILLVPLSFTAPAADAVLAAEPEVIYWNSDAGKPLRARIKPDADYWQLIPWFTNQENQAYCGVASAVTVLNAMPIKKPVDPIYAPFAYFTQSNFFTPEVVKVIGPQTVRTQGMTRDEMVLTLTQLGVKATTVAGDDVDEATLRELVQKAMGDDGQFVLVNFLRRSLGQPGGGHWSVLAAYDVQSDRALILDVSKYMYAPEWVTISTLRKAIDTLDSTSNEARGLVFVSQ
ncbi:MAG: phytochelatin synthase family protein [Gallionellaceae bacterium]